MSSVRRAALLLNGQPPRLADVGYWTAAGASRTTSDGRARPRLGRILATPATTVKAAASATGPPRRRSHRARWAPSQMLTRLRAEAGTSCDGSGRAAGLAVGSRPLRWGM